MFRDKLVCELFLKSVPCLIIGHILIRLLGSLPPRVCESFERVSYQVNSVMPQFRMPRLQPRYPKLARYFSENLRTSKIIVCNEVQFKTFWIISWSTFRFRKHKKDSESKCNNSGSIRYHIKWIKCNTAGVHPKSQNVNNKSVHISLPPCSQHRYSKSQIKVCSNALCRHSFVQLDLLINWPPSIISGYGCLDRHVVLRARVNT